MGKYEKGKINIKRYMDNHKDKDGKPMTQADLGELLGTAGSNISPLLSLSKANEDKFFNLNQLIQIADFFNVSIDDLLGRKIEKRKKADIDFSTILEGLFVFLENGTHYYTIKNINDDTGKTKEIGIIIKHKDDVRIDAYGYSRKFDLLSSIKAYGGLKELPHDSMQHVIPPFIKSQLEDATKFEKNGKIKEEFDTFFFDEELPF